MACWAESSQQAASKAPQREEQGREICVEIWLQPLCLSLGCQVEVKPQSSLCWWDRPNLTAKTGYILNFDYRGQL